MRRRKKLNENTLRKIIRESIKSIIREESEVPYDVYGGIDDYPKNETSEEQWRKLHNAQFGNALSDQWDKDWLEFRKNPQHVLGQDDTDYRLKHDGLSAFPRNGEFDKPGYYGMAALDPEYSSYRNTRNFNGWDVYGNPSDVNHSDEDEELPQEYLDSLNEEQSEVPYDVYGGIDDYPENETREEQWRKLHNSQYGDPSGEQWEKDRKEFTKPTQWMLPNDADYRLRYKPTNGFQRNDQGGYGMDALDPNIKYARDTRMFNGWRIDGNPSDVNHSEEDEELPQEYLNSLNESVRRAIKKVIRRKK